MSNNNKSAFRGVRRQHFPDIQYTICIKVQFITSKSIIIKQYTPVSAQLVSLREVYNQYIPVYILNIYRYIINIYR
jgi:hypothetical protein